jgi:hypothetical protein
MAQRIATSDGYSRHTKGDPKKKDSRECPRQLPHYKRMKLANAEGA